MFLLFRVMSRNPRAQHAAAEKLKRMDKSAIRWIFKGARYAEHVPLQTAYMICRPRYRSMIANLPSPHSTNTLVGYLENLADTIDRCKVNRERVGEILVSFGVDAWTQMMDYTAKYPTSLYARTVYFLIPQFVNRIPVQYFLDAILNHPNQAVRIQAHLCLPKLNDVPDDFHAKVPNSIRYIKEERRYKPLLEFAIFEVRKFEHSGSEAIYRCWYSAHPTLRELAFKAVHYFASMRSHFVEAADSSDEAVRSAAIYSLYSIAHQLEGEEKAAVVDLLIERLEHEPVTSIKVQLVKSLRRYGDQRAAELIIRTLRKHLTPDPEDHDLLWRASLIALENINDARAIPAVAELAGYLAQLSDEKYEKLRDHAYSTLRLLIKRNFASKEKPPRRKPIRYGAGLRER